MLQCLLVSAICNRSTIFVQDRESQDQLVQDLRKTSTASSKLLLAAKSLAADPSGPNSKNLLAAAAKYYSSQDSFILFVKMPLFGCLVSIECYGRSLFMNSAKFELIIESKISFYSFIHVATRGMRG